MTAVEPTAAEVNPEASPVGDHRIPPGTAAVLAILLIIGATASAMRLTAAPKGPTPDDVDLSVPYWGPSEVEQAALAQVAIARRAAAPDPESNKDVAPLIEAYVTFNQADAQVAGDTRSRALAEAHAAYEQWALTFLRHHGAAAYMGLGQRVADDYVLALKKADTTAMTRMGGTFREHLRSTGLVRPNLQPASPAAPYLVRAAFVSRWAQAVRQSQPSDALVSQEERLLMLRWKLAANPLVSPERRVRVARELERLDPAYPVTTALAARFAQDGDWAQAARYYGHAAADNPGDGRLAATAAFAAAKANTQRR